MTKVDPRLVLVSVCVLVGLTASCSLPVDGELTVLDSDDYSDIVHGVSTTTTAPPVVDDEEARRLRLYFVIGQDGGLADVIRTFAEPSIAEVLDALQTQPTEDEVAEYEGEFEGVLQSRLPAGLNPRARPRDDGASTLEIVVDDIGNLRELPNDQPAQAQFVFSQIVCTLTSLNLQNPITAVEFYDSQGRIPIVDSNGSPLVDGRAGRSDFADCETVRDRLDAAEAEGGGSTSTTGG